MLIFPKRFPSDFFKYSFCFSFDSLALGFINVFKVVCELALEDSREGTIVDTSEPSRVLPLPLPEAPSKTSPDVDTEAPSVVTTLVVLSALRNLASVSSLGFASVAASAFKRMRKLCSKTSCVRRPSVRMRVLVAMKLYQWNENEWIIGPATSHRIQNHGRTTPPSPRVSKKLNDIE